MYTVKILTPLGWCFVVSTRRARRSAAWAVLDISRRASWTGPALTELPRMAIRFNSHDSAQKYADHLAGLGFCAFVDYRAYRMI